MLRRIVLLLVVLLPLRAPAGGLFAVGRDDRAVLEFDDGDGSLTRVFAETIDAGFQNPGGIALRPGDGALFVSSRGSGEIWRYETPTGDAVTPAVIGGLFQPGGIDFDAAGALLYFSDAATVDSETVDAVKRLDVAGGTVTTVGSTTGADFADVAVNGAYVFATDTDGNRVIRYPVAGGPGTTVIGSGLSAPTGIVFVSPTLLLVADTGSDRVLEYEDVGGSWGLSRVVLTASSGVGDPCGLALSASGLSVTGCASNDVVEVDLATLAVAPLVAPGAGGLAAPKDAAWQGATLLVASGVANAVLYFDAAGQPTGVAARGVSTQLDGGFAFSDDGTRLAVASFSEGDVVEYDADSGALLRTVGNVCFLPTDVAYGPDGDLFVACLGGNEVQRVDAATGAVVGAFVLGGSGGLVAPRSLAFGPDDDLYVASASGEILRYDGGSGFFLGAFVDASGNGGGLLDPQGFRFHGGVLYVASAFNHEVKTFDATSGAFLATLVSGGGLDTPTALDVGADGDLYVASSGDDSVRRYDATTGAFAGVFVAPGTGGLDGPIDLAFRPLPEPAGATALFAGALLVVGLRRRQSRAS